MSEISAGIAPPAAAAARIETPKTLILTGSASRTSADRPPPESVIGHDRGITPHSPATSPLESSTEVPNNTLVKPAAWDGNSAIVVVDKPADNPENRRDRVEQSPDGLSLKEHLKKASAQEASPPPPPESASHLSEAAAAPSPQKTESPPSEPAPSMNFYERLGLKPDATPDEIKRAYREAARMHHPDTGGNEDFFKLIGEAFSILSDPQMRDKYDAQINAAVAAANLARDYAQPSLVSSACTEISQISADSSLSPHEKGLRATAALASLGEKTADQVPDSPTREVIRALLESGLKPPQKDRKLTNEQMLMLMLIMMFIRSIVLAMGALANAAAGDKEKAMNTLRNILESSEEAGTVFKGLRNNKSVEDVIKDLLPKVTIVEIHPKQLPSSSVSPSETETYPALPHSTGAGAEVATSPPPAELPAFIPMSPDTPPSLTTSVSNAVSASPELPGPANVPRLPETNPGTPEQEFSRVVFSALLRALWLPSKTNVPAPTPTRA